MQRLDAFYGTHDGFETMARDVRERGGLHGTGVFFVVRDGKVSHADFRVGVDEGEFTRVLQRCGADAHGTIREARVNGNDALVMEVVSNDGGTFLTL